MNNNTSVILKCFACLSMDRELYILKDTVTVFVLCPELFRLGNGSHSPCPEVMVCFECCAMIKKIFKFRKQLVHAQKLFNLLQSDNLPVTLSKLSVTSTEVISIPDSIDCSELNLESVIMEEIDNHNNMVPLTTTQQVQVRMETEDPLKINESTQSPTKIIPFEQQNTSTELLNTLVKIKPKPISILANSSIKKTTKSLLKKQRNLKVMKPQNEQFIVNNNSHSIVLDNGVIKIKPQIKEPTAEQHEPVVQNSGKPSLINKEPTVTKQPNMSRQVEPKLIVDSSSEASETVKVQSPNETPLTEQCSENRVVQLPILPQLSLYEKCMEDVTHVKLKKDEMIKFRNEKISHPVFKSSRYKCELCIKPFKSMKSLKSHKVLHAVKSGSFVCSICTQRFPDAISRKTHYMGHFWIFQCLKCPVRCATRKTILAHVKLKHLAGIFDCIQCNEEFTTYHDLIKHRRFNHIKRYPCPKCGKTLSTKAIMRSNMLTHSSELVDCTICNKKYKENCIESHLASHNKDHGQKYYCADCDVFFQTELNYKTHLKETLKHNKIESFGLKCEQCNKYFSAKTTLKLHNELVHNKAEDKFICDLCKREYVSKIHLRRHLQNVHFSKKMDCVC